MQFHNKLLSVRGTIEKVFVVKFTISNDDGHKSITNQPILVFEVSLLPGCQGITTSRAVDESRGG